MANKFQVGNIVKGIKAGTFIVMGHKEIGGEMFNELVEVNPENHSQRHPGTGHLYLADADLVFVQAKQCHYVTPVVGINKGRFLHIWEDFAEANPGHPIRCTGTPLAILFNAATENHEFLLLSTITGQFVEIGYGEWFYQFSESTR